ncbi:MAG: methyltransferase domain-containing protein [Chloroflexi bacterium]|nr:methyltransferase domain-containing protein [Chloroflexota bacterium]
MADNGRVWQANTLVQTYLTGVRGAIPHANEQIEVMLRLIRAACPDVGRFLDLGCGDGILGRAILDEYPRAQGVFVDFSEPMLAVARQRLGDGGDTAVILADYGEPGWTEKIIANGQRLMVNGQFDVVVSGYSIHHQPDERKREIYAEIYGLLRPGGIFINVEHVASATKWVERQFDELFVDALYRYSQTQNLGKSRDQMAQEFYYRPDKVANILAPVETQCQWLRAIGYEHVDCYLKIFELAVFGGVRPNRS